MDIAGLFGRRKVLYEDEVALEAIKDIEKFCNSKKPREIERTIFKALKYRWGVLDRKVHKLKETAEIFAIKIDELLLAEMSLLDRLGWQIKLTEANKKKWLRL